MSSQVQKTNIYIRYHTERGSTHITHEADGGKIVLKDQYDPEKPQLIRYYACLVCGLRFDDQTQNIQPIVRT